MTILVIKDLADSVELDREAMAAITGGSKVPLQRTMLARAASPRMWIGSALTGVPHERPTGRAGSRKRSTLLR